MAATITKNVPETVIEASAIDADVTVNSQFTKASSKRLTSIDFTPGAASDVLVVMDGSASGPNLATLLSSDGENRIKYYALQECDPFIDFSACTLSAGHKAVFTFK